MYLQSVQDCECVSLTGQWNGCNYQYTSAISAQICVPAAPYEVVEKEFISYVSYRARAYSQDNSIGRAVIGARCHRRGRAESRYRCSVGNHRWCKCLRTKPYLFTNWFTQNPKEIRVILTLQRYPHTPKYLSNHSGHCFGTSTVSHP